jgi:Leucine-rich repeat (LRR) protein
MKNYKVFKNINEAIKCPNEVEVLYLKGEAIKELPFPNLIHLSITKNAFKNNLNLEHLSKLKYLDLSYNNLNTINMNLLPSTIRELNLSHNKLDSLKGDIHHLQELENLILSHNCLSTLPRELLLIPLKRLSLDQNNLFHLPEFLKDIPTLNHLSVDENPFNTVEKDRIEKLFGIWF